MSSAQPLRAQSLDDELVRLLDENCIVLGGGTIPQDPTRFGPNLVAFCNAPPSANGTSSGGGAASLQSSMSSVKNRLIQRRRDLARGAGNSATAVYLDEHGYSSPRVAANSWNYLPMEESDGNEPDFRAKRFDLFGSIGYESLDREPTNLEDGFDSSIWSATIGADYRFNGKILGGLVVSLAKQNGDFSGGVGEYEMESLDPTLFMSFLTSPRTFIQVVTGQRSQDFDVDRSVNFTVVLQGGGIAQLTGIATSETASDVLSAGVLFGYDHAVGKFTLGGRAGTNYSRTKIDSFIEGGGTGLELHVDEQTVKSLQATAGFYGSAALSGSSAVFLPQFSVEYVHEFEGTRDLVSATLVEDLLDSAPLVYRVNDPDTGFINVEVGVAAVFPRGIQPYVSVRAMFGNSLFDSVAVTGGVRFEL